MIKRPRSTAAMAIAGIATTLLVVLVLLPMRREMIQVRDHGRIEHSLVYAVSDWCTRKNAGVALDSGALLTHADTSIEMETTRHVRPCASIVAEDENDVLLDVQVRDGSADEPRVWRIWVTARRGVWEIPLQAGWYWPSEGPGAACRIKDPSDLDAAWQAIEASTPALAQSDPAH